MIIQYLWIIGFPVIIFLCYLFNRLKHEGNASVEIIGMGALFYISGLVIL